MLPSTAPAPLKSAEPTPAAALAKPGTIPAAIKAPRPTKPPVLINALPANPAPDMATLPTPPKADPAKRPAPPNTLPPSLPARFKPLIILPRLTLLFLRFLRSLESRSRSMSKPSSSPPPKRPPIPFLIFLIMSPMRSKVFFISCFLTSLSSLLWSDLLTFSRSFMLCQLPIRPLTASLPAVIFSMSLSFLALTFSAKEDFFNFSIPALVLSLRSLTF